MRAVEVPLQREIVRRSSSAPTSLAEQTLGWHPQIDLREGLVRTNEWYRRSLD
jgi:nucleoside-diphosphate-sugar epimerase